MEKEQVYLHEAHCKLLVDELSQIPKDYFYDVYDKALRFPIKTLTGKNPFSDMKLPFDKLR